MLRLILRYIVLFLSYVVVGALQKPLFMLVHGGMSATPIGAADWFAVMWHGLPMDCAVAAYFTALPALLMMVECAIGPRRFFRVAEHVWFVLSAVVLSAVIVLDLGLYASWGFRLDMSPVFYFTTSPSAAMASVTAGQICLAGLGFTVAGVLIYMLFRYGFMRMAVPHTPQLAMRGRVGATVVGLLLVGLLFLPMRGGFTVSTMNLSRSYFSTNQFLNHAAVNPFFSLFYSATHQDDFASQFRYMADDEANRQFDELRTAADRGFSGADSLLIEATPDVYIILLESFSAELMPSLGGEPIAVKLDSVAGDGISFSNFYATSFRTDRGVPAVLSGFPGAPTASVMKFAEKTSSLPSIASALARNGWSTSYYYGGDINFTNMLAYLMNTGFTHTVRDTDFPIADRTGKWGAHDHLVFERCLADVEATPMDASPALRVIQTSSSHEPFEVPYCRLSDERANAFAYTDSCTADFLNRLAATPRYDRSLVILVPDHFGAYPRNLQDPLRRHHVPFIMTGGALAERGMVVDAYGSQADIAPTLLDMLRLPGGSDFTFGASLFDTSAPKFAFFSEPSFMGMVDGRGHVVVNLESDEVMENSLAPDTLMLHQAKAYMQKLYDNFSNL